MKKNQEKAAGNIPSGFYNSSLTAQGREGEHKRYPMDFYTSHSDEEPMQTIVKGFPGDFYKTGKD